MIYLLCILAGCVVGIVISMISVCCETEEEDSGYHSEVCSCDKCGHYINALPNQPCACGNGTYRTVERLGLW